MKERSGLGAFVTFGLVATLGVSAAINKVAGVDAHDIDTGQALSGSMAGPVVPTSCRPENFISRDADLKYSGIYYFPGELDSYPVRLDQVRANYYGDGERLNTFTASGEYFDPNVMAAASWFYPIGTELSVSWQGRTIQVRVWDRGPNRVANPDVYIDLTKGAMIALTGQAASAYGVTIEPVC